MPDQERVHLLVRHGARNLAGVVRAGESWRAAARRVAATVPGEPEAFDLSGEPKVFVVSDDSRIALRAMTRGDLPDLSGWLHQPEVARWFAGDGGADLPALTARLGPSLDGVGDAGTSPPRWWVVESHGRSIGFCQDYLLRDHPEFGVPEADETAVGVDYAIGEQRFAGRGVGTRLLWSWLESVRRRRPEARTVVAAPAHTNAASLRVLAKVGFEPGLWFDSPRPDGSVATLVHCRLDVATVLGNLG